MKVDALPGLDGPRRGALERPARPLAPPSRLPHLAVADRVGRAPSLRIARCRSCTVTDDDGSLAGVLPLYEDGPGRQRFIGGVDVSDYLDLIALAGREEEVWQALLQHRAGAAGRVGPPRDPRGLAHRRRPARARAGCRAAGARWSGGPLSGAGAARDVGRVPREALRQGPPRAPAQDAQARARAARGDRARRTRTPRDGTRRWRAFLTLHRLSKVGKARFMDERMERFFRDATAALAAQGLGAAVVPRVRGRGGGRFLCLEYAGQRRALQLGLRSRARAQLAPGIVLLAHVIRDAIDRGIPVFDFLRGEEPYKYGFGPTPEDLFNIRVGCREPPRRDALRAHLPARRARRQGDGRHERLRARDGARAGPHGRARGRLHALAERHDSPRGRAGAGRARHPSARGPRGADAARGAPPPPRRVRGGRRRRSRGRRGSTTTSSTRTTGSRAWRGSQLRERWGVPLVQMFHTLGRLKNSVAQTPDELEPELRIAEESRIVAEADRIVAANVVERAHLVWYYGARSRARRGHPLRRGHRAVPADGSGHGQGPARAAARSAAALRGAAHADQGPRDAAGGHGRDPRARLSPRRRRRARRAGRRATAPRCGRR